MSMDKRYEWRDQQALVNEGIQGFLKNPGKEQLDHVLALMHAYATAVQGGQIEIPQRWISIC